MGTNFELGFQQIMVIKFNLEEVKQGDRFAVSKKQPYDCCPENWSWNSRSGDPISNKMHFELHKGPYQTCSEFMLSLLFLLEEQIGNCVSMIFDLAVFMDTQFGGIERAKMFNK
jgi:hypothetical protein